LFYFVRDNFEYVSDPTAYEYVKTAKESLISGGGDCDDASVLLANLLDAIGIRSRFVFVPGHVYLQANMPDVLNKYKVEGDMVNLDATCSYCEFGEMSWKNADKEKSYLG
jgi:transglutaminase-like putative cysteine protease